MQSITCRWPGLEQNRAEPAKITTMSTGDGTDRGGPTSPGGHDVKRLGRAVVFVHQHDRRIRDPLLRASIEILLLVGTAMDFAARLKDYRSVVPLTHELTVRYARHAGLGQKQLIDTVLPALKAAGILDYKLKPDGSILEVDEYVGVSSSLIEQTIALLRSFSPTRADLAVLHSVEVGAVSPLALSQHKEIVKARAGFTDREVDEAVRLTQAVGLNLTIMSADLGEHVIFSPYVWGNRQLDLAKFMRRLPPNERDVLLNMSEQVLQTPGLHVSRLQASQPVIRSAQSVGLIQAATVKSATGISSTYAFSPLLEAEDNSLTTSEAFHQRKLFVAHILFGHEQSRPSTGQISNPAVLVDRLIRRGRVGPATAIHTDYHLLEAAGVVTVEPGYGDRAYLRLVKREIAEAGLSWIARITDPGGADAVELTQAPGRFLTPEDERGEFEEGAAQEVLISSVHELRKEMQNAARREDPFS